MTPDPSLALHLRIVGVLMVLLVAVNLLVPGWFHWREELSRLSLLTRQIVIAHAASIVLLLALTAALLLTSAEALLEPGAVSRALLVGLTVFWGVRMLMQWFFYSPRVWRGNRLYTVMHVVFSLGWIYMTGVFGVALRAVWSRG